MGLVWDPGGILLIVYYIWFIPFFPQSNVKKGHPGHFWFHMCLSFYARLPDYCLGMIWAEVHIFSPRGPDSSQAFYPTGKQLFDPLAKNFCLVGQKTCLNQALKDWIGVEICTSGYGLSGQEGVSNHFRTACNMLSRKQVAALFLREKNK